MKLACFLVLVLSLLADAKCGLLKGLTESLTDSLRKVTNEVQSVISTVEDKGSDAITKVAGTFGEGAEKVANEIGSTLSLVDSNNKHSIEGGENEEISTKTLDTNTTANDSNGHITKNDFDEDPKENANANNYVKDVKDLMKYTSEERRNISENEIETSCISPDMIRFGKDTDNQKAADQNMFITSKANFVAGCLKGYLRAEDGTCQPLEY